MMALTLAVGWFWLYPPDYAATARTAAAAAFGLANIEIGWGQNDFAPAVQNALTHAWSLGVEEQFYLLWPFVLAAFVCARLIW
jgi:peptidoglycan/LPS O-acetylase OafA/YrhL